MLLLERGQPVPREADNWSVEAVFFDKKYGAKETWLDRRGVPFNPGAYYNVGGSTKFYGAAMFRFRERDFEALQHHEGISPAWPIRYDDLAPYYDEAERLFGVHGDDSADPTAPQRHKAYPFPAIRIRADHRPDGGAVSLSGPASLAFAAGDRRAAWRQVHILQDLRWFPLQTGRQERRRDLPRRAGAGDGLGSRSGPAPMHNGFCWRRTAGR